MRAAAPVGLAEGRRTLAAVVALFVVSGVLFATWASRLPALRDLLHLSSAQLGLLLLCVSVGAVGSLPFSGSLVQRLGPRGAVTGAAVLLTTSLAVAGTLPPMPVLVAALVCTGTGTAVWDVTMNVEGARAEQLLGRSIMPALHALFSLGTVLGAGVGALAAARDVPLPVHLPVAAVLGLLVVLPFRGRLAGRSGARGGTRGAVGRPRRAWAAWGERRTLALGVVVLGAALAEGSANDWLAVALVDGYRLDHAWAAAGLGLFVATMTVGRFAGTAVIDRLGRVAALRVSAGLAILGVVTVVGAAALPGVPRPVLLGGGALGIVVWGCGAALGFPVGMSAAADDTAHAAARVSVVSTIGYCAFLIGPLLIGGLATRVGVLTAFCLVPVVVALGLPMSDAARSVAPEPVREVT